VSPLWRLNADIMDRSNIFKTVAVALIVFTIRFTKY